MFTRKAWILDRETYNERRSIMEANGATGLDASREAADTAHKTRFGRVCTSAANGDWTPAETWITEIRERFGTQASNDLLSDIYDSLSKELDWR